MTKGSGFSVSGYVVRFCTRYGECNHKSSTKPVCPNPTDTEFYINPNVSLKNLEKSPLTAAHNNGHVIGYCSFAIKTSNGIFVECFIDDAYYIECMRRRYEEHINMYNKYLDSFETYLKKNLCSFSLSHCAQTNEVKHIALVDTPARIGTAVDYTPNSSVLLKRRAENIHISDIIASHSTVYLSASDRKDYLIANAKLSHNRNDIVFINASKKRKMSEITENDIDDVIIRLLKKRKLPKTENNDINNENPEFITYKRPKLDETTTTRNNNKDNPSLMEAVTEGFKGVMAILKANSKMLEDSQMQETQEKHQEPPPVSTAAITIDAAKPAVLSFTDIPEEKLDYIIDLIMNKNKK